MNRIDQINSLIEQCNEFTVQINSAMIWNLNDGIDMTEGINTDESKWKIFCNDVETYFSMYPGFPSSNKFKPILDSLCSTQNPVVGSDQVETLRIELHRLKNAVKVENENEVIPKMSEVITEEKIYIVLSAIRENPKVKWDDLSFRKDDFFEILEIIDDEKLAKGIRFSRGKNNKVLIAFYDDARLTLDGIRYLDDRKKAEPKVVSDDDDLVTIFLSYSWKDSDLCNSIEGYLLNKGVHVARDIRDIGTWHSIKNFMGQIRKQDFVTLLISDDYLRSDNCMYEVTELIKDDDYSYKIFPVVIEKSIYDPVKRLTYVSFWERKKEELEAVLNTVSSVNRSSEMETLRRYTEIAFNIGRFLKTVADMNNPQIDDVSEAIWNQVENYRNTKEQSV